MKKIILIIQSPMDFKYAIEILNQHKSEDVEVLVTGSKGVYECALEIFNNVRCITPPSLSEGALIYIFKLLRLRAVNKKEMLNVESIFVPNFINDVIASSMLAAGEMYGVKIFKYSKYLDVLIEGGGALSVKDKLASWMYSLALCTIFMSKRFRTVKYSTRHFIRYLPKKHTDLNVQPVDLNIAIDDEPSNIPLGVLFIDGGQVANTYIANYDAQLQIIIKALSVHGVTVKKHPTHGISNVLESYMYANEFSQMNSNWPIEFIDLSKYRAVVSIDSKGLAEARHSNVISVQNLFEYKFESNKTMVYQYINDAREDRAPIKFVCSVEELIRAV